MNTLRNAIGTLKSTHISKRRLILVLLCLVILCSLCMAIWQSVYTSHLSSQQSTLHIYYHSSLRDTSPWGGGDTVHLPVATNPWGGGDVKHHLLVATNPWGGGDIKHHLHTSS